MATNFNKGLRLTLILSLLSGPVVFAVLYAAASLSESLEKERATTSGDIFDKVAEEYDIKPAEWEQDDPIVNLPEGFVLDEQPGINLPGDEWVTIEERELTPEEEFLIALQNPNRRPYSPPKEDFPLECVLFFWVVGFVLVWVVSTLVRKSWRSAICHYIAEAFRYGGKQMLCDIIKWTIIIIIAAVVFGIAYRIATKGSSAWRGF